jgi:uncharacterized protein YhfF
VVEEFWQEFTAATGISGSYDAWAFGGPSFPEMATELAFLVRNGPKRATAGLVVDEDPIPEVGDLSVILDGKGSPVCVIRTTEVEIRRFADVDEAFAWDEGEGDRTLQWWREAHVKFFERVGYRIDSDSPMVLERFELLWPIAIQEPAG